MIHWSAILSAFSGRPSAALGWAAREARPNHSKTRRLAQFGLMAALLAASGLGPGHHVWSQPDHVALRVPYRLQAQPNQAAPPAAESEGREAPSRSTPLGPWGSRLRPASGDVGLQIFEEDAPGGTYSLTPTNTPAPEQALPERSAEPETPAVNGARLRIPYLKVDEPVAVIGIRDGQWDISQLVTNVGWLTTTGTHPGDDLAMAFVGHITVSAARRGPFANLLKLPSGAAVIYSSGGKDYLYAVREKAGVLPEDVNRLYVPDGNALLLVTCTDWDFLGLTYSKRLLVRAELVRTLDVEAGTP